MKRNLVLVLLFVFMLSVAGCGGQIPSEKTQEKVKTELVDLVVGTAPGPVSYSLAYMVTQPDEGLNITLRPWKMYDQLLAMITAEQVNLSSTPITNAIMLYNKGFDVQLINISVWGMLYVLSPDDTVQEIADLKGEKIAVAGKGGIHDLVFRHLLIKNGLDPDKDVQILYMDLPEASGKLATSELKFAVLNEPNSSMATLNAKKGGVELHRVLDLQEEWQKVTGQKEARIPQAGFVVVNAKSVDKAAVAKFQESFMLAAQWVNEHPQEAGTIVEKQFDWMKAPAVQQSLQFARLDPVPAADCKSEIEVFFKELSETAPAEAMGGKLPDAAFYFQP